VIKYTAGWDNDSTVRTGPKSNLIPRHFPAGHLLDTCEHANQLKCEPFIPTGFADSCRPPVGVRCAIAHAEDEGTDCHICEARRKSA